jgi:hypothetical protein
MRQRTAGLGAALTLAAAACAAHGAGAPKDGKAMTRQEHRWEVSEGDTPILDLSNMPGTVAGPGGESAPHALLSARIRSAAHEARLRALLGAASSVPDLVSRMVSEGWRVRLTTPQRRWKVYDGEQLVLEVSDVPGPIVDVTAPPPPGAKPTFHPFLSASAYSAWHGDRLHALLKESAGVDDFLERLRKAELRVEPVKD